MAGGKKWTPKKAAFVAAYAKCGNVTEACEIAGVSKSVHYDWLKNDEIYKKAIKEALSEAVDLMEKEARRRAVEGTDEPVFYKGGECGKIRKYSDTLLIFLLKAARPKKYRENFKTEISGKVGFDIGGTETAILTLEEMQQRVASRLRMKVPAAKKNGHSNGHNGTNHTNGNGKH